MLLIYHEKITTPTILLNKRFYDLDIVWHQHFSFLNILAFQCWVNSRVGVVFHKVPTLTKSCMHACKFHHAPKFAQPRAWSFDAALYSENICIHENQEINFSTIDEEERNEKYSFPVNGKPQCSSYFRFKPQKAQL
jgi:hypothetical protein